MNRPRLISPCSVTAHATLAVALVLAAGALPASFVNWENPHVSPIDMTPDGTRLLTVNTPDNRLAVFDLTSGLPVLAAEIPVGLDPVSVRARTNNEAWVVNHISDSISIVDLSTLAVTETIATGDEPADVVFAGNDLAFVSCSQVNRVQVFDASAPGDPLAELDVLGEDPRAMSVSPTGDRVYVAVFESGNASTVIAGSHNVLGLVLDDSDGPYSGQTPPPNAGLGFNPPLNPANPAPPPTSLVVKKAEDGRWLDDNIGDWTDFINGSKSFRTERVEGWDMPDRDLAVIDTTTLAVTYARRLMNHNMALGVNPATGDISVVGTDGTNEIRFEPNLNGTFIRVLHAVVDEATGMSDIIDLNPHLDYSVSSLPQNERDRSIGDPRGIVWNSAGTRAFITGMGSNNLVVIDGSGARADAEQIEVGEGPTGLVIDEARDQLYVMNKFDASVSTVSLATESETARLPLFDPTPDAIQVGRRHLYSTHDTSGLGQASCASCHTDSRMDRLAWDLGNPAGEMKSTAGQNLGGWNLFTDGGFDAEWHPMKGPMVTQTLQDIIGHEPHHWRGDRDGLEEFNTTFDGLQGGEQISDQEMQEFEDFLAAIHFPPNPYRNLDNSLPSDLPLPNFFAAGNQAPPGTPLPSGSAVQGHEMFNPPGFPADNPFQCATCHTLPTGLGTNFELVNGNLVEIPTGPNGENHLGFVSSDGDVQRTLKVPQLRNLHERIGFDTTQPENLAGFGFHHDGSFDSLSRFFRFGFPGISDSQELADMIAFMLAFSGSELDPSGNSQFHPPGPDGQDTHAAVGKQTTILDGSNLPDRQRGFLQVVRGLAEEGKVDLVAKGRHLGEMRGYLYVGGGQFQSDRAAEILTGGQLLQRVGLGTELTATVVPAGSGTRIGIDRDEDGILDGDET